MVHPCALILAHDLTLDNLWLLRVGPGYLPVQYSASLGLAPSDGARAGCSGTPTVPLLWSSDLRHPRDLELGTLAGFLEQAVR